MTKKEFKKKCKEEKTKSYKFSLLGSILAAIGLVIVLGGLFLITDIPKQLVYYGIGVGFAIVGMALDITGDIMMSKEYKEQVK